MTFLDPRMWDGVALAVVMALPMLEERLLVGSASK
jgi:hypothetical protein